MNARIETDALAASLYGRVATQSVIEILAERARLHPQRVLFRFLDEQGEEAEAMSYGEAWQRTCAVAAELSARGVAGDRVALFHPAGLDFIVAFLGCLLAGRVAVPLNLPSKRRVDRCQRILRDCGCTLALTVSSLQGSLQDILSGGEGIALDWLCSDTLRDLVVAAPAALPAADARLAFLQYTSGSTSHPKGVMVSQRNIATNLRMMRNAWQLDHASTMVFWQPHHHDMGLILGQLLPLMLGNETVLMGPNTFVRQPLLWLQTIARYRAVLAGGPNFAYELAVQRWQPGRLEGCDLSSWRVALNGADVVRAATLARFAETFAPLGYRDTAMLPCYGLAEATLFVSGGPVDTRPVERTVDIAAAEQGGEIRPAGDRGGRTVVGCGLPSDEIELAIVDPHTRQRLGPDRVGEIWVAGETDALGYWNLPELSAETFCARVEGGAGRPFLRTGDLGFVGADDGQLYICGRMKDLLIVDGRNLHPEDVEYTIVESHPLIKPQSCAVFEDERDGRRRIVAVIETDRELRRQLPDIEKALRMQVRRAVSEEHGLPLGEVVFIAPATLRKTTSGKVQRALMRQLFEQGGLDIVGVAADRDAA